MNSHSRRSDATQTKKQATAYAERLAMQSVYVCIVRTSYGYGVIVDHPYNLRVTGDAMNTVILKHNGKWVIKIWNMQGTTVIRCLWLVVYITH